MKTILTKKQIQFVQAARATYGNEIEMLSREDILAVCATFKLKEPQWLIKPEYRVPEHRGVYYIPNLEGKAPSTNKKSVAVSRGQGGDDVVPAPSDTPAVMVENIVAMPKEKSKLTISTVAGQHDNLVPLRDKNFVRFGIYSDLKTIIASGVFYPVFITGLSGNGKSFTPEQICAELKREFYRVNIQKNTNEDDLLGGFRLIAGETVWDDGPVVRAAERGAVLLLDEIDYGSAEITCMQNVLEGKPFFLKKINRLVTPKAGFTIIATANTKGQGDTVGKFAFTNVLNEAFLERFSVTLEQDYPPASVEIKILNNNFRSLGLTTEETGDFADKLVKWAGANRDTYKKGGFSEILSTRRLVHIAKAFTMFKARLKAVEICLNRFDDESKAALYDLYQKIDAAPVDNSITSNAVQSPDVATDPDGGVPF